MGCSIVVFPRHVDNNVHNMSLSDYMFTLSYLILFVYWKGTFDLHVINSCATEILLLVDMQKYMTNFSLILYIWNYFYILSHYVLKFIY